MKKFIILALCLIIIISVWFFACFKQKNNENKIGLNHFKQSNIKFNGTIYTKGENTVYLETFFIDEDILSEMSSNKNIETIYVLDKNGEKLNLKDTSLEIEHENENTLIRVLKSTLELNENQLKENYSLDKMVIKYVDGKEEIFNLGNLNINTTKTHKNILAYHSSQELIKTNVNKNVPPGIIINVGKLDYKKITLKDVDLGLNGVEVDYKKVKVVDKYHQLHQSDYNNIEIARDNRKEENFNGVDIEFSEHEIVAIVIPFKINIDFKEENIIYMVNPKLTLEADGKKEVLVGDMVEKNSFNSDEKELKDQLDKDGI